jgi:hypothetical protein
MNTFKRKSLYAALGGLVAAGAAGTANAVFVNNEGLGQALVYPYYSARNGNDTLLSVVNSTASAKVVKVRFLEGKNSKEVLDFNLFMSPFDVWTAAITATADGAKMLTADRSCTSPAIPAGGVEFRNLLFTTSEGDTSKDRTREGYVEILEMGVIASATLEASVTHINGVPPCIGLPGNTVAAGVLDVPQGGLFGSGSIVNVNNGTDFSYDPVAFDEWSDTVNYTGPGSVLPTLASASPTVSTTISARQGVVIAGWDTGEDAVSSTIMHDQIYNEYVIDPSIAAGTDWVVSFPTKRFYVAVGTGTARPPFQSNFLNGTGSCDDISLAYYDREERKPGATVDFSPSPSPTGPQLCWEINVITFNNTNVLGSSLARNINPTDPVTGATYPSGWAVIGFPTLIAGAHPLVHQLISNGGFAFSPTTGFNDFIDSATFTGLPSLGFAAQQYFNGLVGTPPVQSNYGGTFLHKQTKNITYTQSLNGTTVP